MGGDHQVRRSGFGGGGYDARGKLILILQSNPFRACCGFGLRFLTPVRQPGGGQFRLLRILRDQLRRGLVCGLKG